MDYTAVGDTTNSRTAFSKSHRRLDRHFRGDPAARSGLLRSARSGEVTVKGRVAAVHAFEVIGEREVMDRIDAIAAMGLTPLVGRDRELEQLTTAFDAALASHGQVVFVVGDAGIGKSRLLHEFQLALASRPHAWMEGRCASYARTTAFHVVADAVRRSLGIGERDDELAALAKVEAAEQAVGRRSRVDPSLRTRAAVVADRRRAHLGNGRDHAPQRDVPRVAGALLARRSTPPIVLVHRRRSLDRLGVGGVPVVPGRVDARNEGAAALTHRPGYRHVSATGAITCVSRCSR
jgi:hypothetical protein